MGAWDVRYHIRTWAIGHPVRHDWAATQDAVQQLPPPFPLQKELNLSQFVGRGNAVRRQLRAGHPHILRACVLRQNLAGVLRLLAKYCLMRRHKMIFIAFQIT